MNYVTDTSTFKQQALSVKKDKGIKTFEAQDLIAKENGFEKWSQLAKYANDCSALNETFQNKYVSAMDSPVCDFTGKSLFKALNPEDAVIKLSPPFKKNVQLSFIKHISPSSWIRRELINAYKLVFASYSPANEESPFESREGGYQYPTVETWDLLNGEIDFEIDLSENDRELIIDALGHQEWVSKEFLEGL